MATSDAVKILYDRFVKSPKDLADLKKFALENKVEKLGFVTLVNLTFDS